MRKHPLIVGRRYRITHGGSAFPHLVNFNIEITRAGFARVIDGSSKNLEIATFGLGLRANPVREVCQCQAYKWPHRKGSGQCLALEFGPFCGECGQPCEAQVVEADFNQGLCVISSCHEAECFDDAELKIHLTSRDFDDETRS